ncbi:hypothetical protein DOTSEDRAFT_76022 [Dothistroma septosporum NZE10]|uniref:Uncharacterized protein n=1 Tax=Dothistroma septosporum (strain NZE10 / CBS 128990) TaxID=675120 RepID=N1Q1H3_DOTSN|nr:hypothetical protein DOTSEDRAFT_76022 [Dothistroma septosporum NZE10]
MPPKTRSSHQLLDAPPQQAKIAARRRTLVHPRASPPKLKKRDSTLTQLGFYHSSSPTIETQWTIPVTSDAEDEDEEYEEPRAKKRRKTLGSSTKAGGKKAKKGGSESQSTLTQNWRASGYVLDSYDTSDEEDLVRVDEGMQPPPSAQPKPARPLPRRRPAPDAGETQIQGDNLLGAYLDNDWSSESELEAASSASLTQSQLAHFAQSQEKHSTRPTTAESKTTPKTPKRITKTEIPDSAETSSAPISSRSTTSASGYARSPLKERSTNIPFQNISQQPTGKAARGKILIGQIQLDDANALKGPVGQWSAKLAVTPKKAQKMTTQPQERQQTDSSPTLSQSKRQRSGTTVSTAGKRTFARISTIADSDDSDIELGDIEQPKFGTLTRSADDYAHVDTFRRSSQRSASKLPKANFKTVETVALLGNHSKMQVDGEAAERYVEDSPSRSQDGVIPNGDSPADHASRLGEADTPLDTTHTKNDATKVSAPCEAVAIDDSDAEEEFGEEDDYTEDDLDGHPYGKDGHHDDDEDDTYNQTYDPVADALARDGARAWRTETQLQRDDLEQAKRQEAMVEESDEDIEEQIAADDIVVVPSSQDEERVPSSQDFADPGQKLAVLGSPGRPTAGDLDDSGYASQGMLEEEAANSLPHSMPPPNKPQQPLAELPRPSQVSTVGDTQSQRSRPNSAHGILQPWAAESIPSSPREADVGLPEDPIERSPQKSYPQTLSSSPFPMPPGMTRRSRRDCTDTQSSGLMDFSLPPPPPLLLSSSRLQEGSSSR